MRRTTTAELILAYRHAKHALFQEQRGMTRLDSAVSEDSLPTFIADLRKRLASSPGWFSKEELGQIWIVPKKSEPIRRGRAISTIGESASAPTRIHVRPHLAPSTAFALVEVLWLWDFGPALELLLSEHSLGNRLRIFEGKVDMRSRGPFQFWPKQYGKFRDGTFTVARRLLKEPNGHCVLTTFDLAGCYDSIDPRFLLEPGFIRDVQFKSQQAGIAFDVSEFGEATTTLVEQFRTYRRRAGRLLGARLETGIPIGALTSGLVANLALSTLDEHLLRLPGVRHYARYVDDVLVVTDTAPSHPRSATRTVREMLPARKTGDRDSIVLDERHLKRPGCSLTLSGSKLKVYHLKGRRGLDFLGTIERDVRWIASERRAFLNPDGLGSDSPFASLVAGSDSQAPVQVLRQVDRLKVERYAASVQLGKIAVGVEMLPPQQARGWCRAQLRSLVGMTTDADNWCDFAEMTFRALASCLRATDYKTARTILIRHRRRIRRLVRKPNDHPLQWGKVPLTKEIVRRRLVAWFEMRQIECIAASIRLESLATADGTSAVLNRLGASISVFGRRPPKPEDLRAVALLFARTDLRTADRESDRREATIDDGVSRRARDRRGLSAAFRRSALAETFEPASEFAEICTSQSDRTYGKLSMLDLVLMTRPPTSFDVQLRFAQAGRSPSNAIRVTNALRGTNYEENTARGIPNEFLDITPPFIGSLLGIQDVTLLLANLRSDPEWFTAAAKGVPELGSERLNRVARVVNLAIAKARDKAFPILIFPELSVPRAWLRPLVARMLSEGEQGIGVIAGLEYGRKAHKVANHAVAVLSTGRHGAAVAVWKKGRPAREEDKELSKLSLTLEGAPFSRPMLVRTSAGTFSVLICSEMLDVELRATLLGAIDFLIVPSWNKDTATFDHTVQTVANDLHCYVAIANNGVFSDSRIFVPKRLRYERDVCRLICRSDDEVLASTINVKSLRDFQRDSLEDREFPPEHPENEGPEFKAVPPAYKNRRVKLKKAPR